MKPTGGSKRREGTSALLVIVAASSCSCAIIFRALQIQERSALFGGRREDNETFPDCVDREVHEQIGYYFAAESFELIGRYCGSDWAHLASMLLGDVENQSVVEGLQGARYPSGIAHDSAGTPSAQIINLLWRGTAASYTSSWMWRKPTNGGGLYGRG
jgi:hypothetical protein